ncbi:hypothetical protein X801_00574, partial [Opisthorchis viverrini]
MAILSVQVNLYKTGRQYRQFPTDILSWHTNVRLNARGRTCTTIVDIPGRLLFNNDQPRKESVLEVLYTLNNGKGRCTYNGFLTAQYEYTMSAYV